jgi:hypothetical protein
LVSCFCYRKVLSSPSSIEVAHGFILGHMPSSIQEFYLAPVHPHPVAPSVLQLVSEQVGTPVVLNRLCDLKPAWRTVSSSLWFLMVKILVIGRTE